MKTKFYTQSTQEFHEVGNNFHFFRQLCPFKRN